MNSGKLRLPLDGYADTRPLEFRAMLKAVLSCSAIGAPATVKAATEAFVARTGADELMITSQIFDHGARVRSYELLAELFAASAASASAVEA